MRAVDFPDLVAGVGALFGLSHPAGRCFSAIWRAAQAPCADELTAVLGLSRSNVSTALKELRDWGLIARARAPGDRKEYFTAPPEPWEVFRIMLAARRRRFLAPHLDRILAYEAETGDARAAALHSMLFLVSDNMARQAALTPAELEREFQGPENREKPKSSGKKKKRKRKN